MSKPKKPAKTNRRPAATGAQPAARRQRVKVIGPDFKVRWEWRESL